MKNKEVIYFIEVDDCKNDFIVNVLPFALAGAFGILTNSVLTIFMMWVFNATALAVVFTVILSINFLAEIIGAVVLVPVYSKVLKRIENKL